MRADHIIRTSAAAGLWLWLGAAAPPIAFTSVEARLEPAEAAYRALWQQEGEAIIAALERNAGLPFPPAPIELLVTDSATMTSSDGRTIRMRAGYSPSFAKATLAHEMGHRLALALPRTGEMDDHRVLYLFLYDAWRDLYGRAFADRMVRIERSFRSHYDYDAAWTWALSMTRAERQVRLKWLRSGLRRAAATADSPADTGSIGRNTSSRPAQGSSGGAQTTDTRPRLSPG